VVRCRCAVLAAATGLIAVACDSTKPLPPAVFVTPATLTLEDGQSAKLTATLRNPKTRTVSWSSSAPAVATVDELGNVTGVTNGTANVVVKMVDDTTINATVPVTVSGPAVATVSVTPNVATVFVGTIRNLSAVPRAADGRRLTGRTVSWTSPDVAIATVSSTGVVRGIAPGGPITLTATSEGRLATAAVRVAHAAELCPFITPLAVGQRADGRLALGDCEFSLDESYVDVYEFTLAAAGTVQIDMVSVDLDSYLGFFNGAGPFIAEDDNTGGGRDARIVAQVAAGKYRIWANTIAGGLSGAYSLTVTLR
jgi:predicted component of type VI protein secretion system